MIRGGQMLFPKMVLQGLKGFLVLLLSGLHAACQRLCPALQGGDQVRQTSVLCCGHQGDQSTLLQVEKQMSHNARKIAQEVMIKEVLSLLVIEKHVLLQTYCIHKLSSKY
jgi:hypothetical protein